MFTCVLSKHNGCHFELLGLNIFIHKVLNKEKWCRIPVSSATTLILQKDLLQTLLLCASSSVARRNANFYPFCLLYMYIQFLKQPDQWDAHFKDTWLVSEHFPIRTNLAPEIQPVSFLAAKFSVPWMLRYVQSQTQTVTTEAHVLPNSDPNNIFSFPVQHISPFFVLTENCALLASLQLLWNKDWSFTFYLKTLKAVSREQEKHPLTRKVISWHSQMDLLYFSEQESNVRQVNVSVRQELPPVG